MILVDTGVWIEHLRAGRSRLDELLDQDRVLGHPWVYGELLLGGLSRKGGAKRRYPKLPRAVLASEVEIVQVIQTRALTGAGIGYVDAGLVASTLLTRDALLWAKDTKLRAAAERIGIAYRP